MTLPDWCPSDTPWIIADCLSETEFSMKDIPDNSVDLVVTDPPYGIGASRYKRANTQHGKSLAKYKDYGEEDWDDNRISKDCFDEMFRISKNQIIFGGNYYVDYFYPTACWIVWDKENGDNGYADCELAWTSFNSAVRLIKYKWHGMF